MCCWEFVRVLVSMYHTTLKLCHGVQRLRLTAPRSAPFCDECKYKQVFTCKLHFFFCRVTGCAYLCLARGVDVLLQHTVKRTVMEMTKASVRGGVK